MWRRKSRTWRRQWLTGQSRRLRQLCLLAAPPQFFLAILWVFLWCALTSTEMWCWSRQNCLCIVYNYNGAQRYEQFLQVSRLYRALILLHQALCLLSTFVSSLFMVLYNIYVVKITKILVTSFASSSNELSLVWLCITGWLTIVLQCYDAVGCVTWRIKLSPKLPNYINVLLDGTLNYTVPYYLPTMHSSVYYCCCCSLNQSCFPTSVRVLQWSSQQKLYGSLEQNFMQLRCHCLCLTDSGKALMM